MWNLARGGNREVSWSSAWPSAVKESPRTNGRWGSMDSDPLRCSWAMWLSPTPSHVLGRSFWPFSSMQDCGLPSRDQLFMVQFKTLLPRASPLPAAIPWVSLVSAHWHSQVGSPSSRCPATSCLSCQSSPSSWVPAVGFSLWLILSQAAEAHFSPKLSFLP